MSLYQSDWKPRGIRSEWDKTGLSNEDAAMCIRRHYMLKPEIDVTDAVTWWREDGSLAVLAADLSTGRRLIMRQGRNNTISFEHPCHD